MLPSYRTALPAESIAMTKWMKTVARYATLTSITIVAIGVMAWVSMRDDSAARHAKEQITTPVPAVATPKPLVAIEQLDAALQEVTEKFSGKLRPWETYSIGFEQPGRLIELGEDSQGLPLDDGSLVAAGQVLARIDQRVLQARRAEASAQLEQSSSDLARARELRNEDFGAITEAEFQEALTANALAQASLDIAEKNLQDAVIYAPVDATISQRMAEPGEYIGANTTIFELVQNDDLLLVADVPESKIPELQKRMRTVKRIRKEGKQSDPEANVFRARVKLESRDRFGRQLPLIDAEVYRIAELADQRTGLFEVEIRVPNAERLFRPGMVATCEVVVDRISAYRVPETAVLFRGEETYVFGLAREPKPLHVMFWNIGQTEVASAKRVSLTEWIDQGDYLLVPSTSAELDRVVVRGQQRLSDGQLVRVVDESTKIDEPKYVTPGTKSKPPSVVQRQSP